VRGVNARPTWKRWRAATAAAVETPSLCRRQQSDRSPQTGRVNRRSDRAMVDDAATFPILDAINDTLRRRQHAAGAMTVTSRRAAVTSAPAAIVTSSLLRRPRIVTARDLRCGRGLQGPAGQGRRGDVTVTSPRNGCVNGSAARSRDDDDDVSGGDDAPVTSVPWHVMSRWCRYAALSSLLALWLVT